MTKKKLLTDLHIHSKFSDGSLSISELVDLYGKNNFDVIAITDHFAEDTNFFGRFAHYLKYSLRQNNLDQYFSTLKKEAQRAWDKYSMVLLPGYEITKNSLYNNRSSHFLVIGNETYIDPNLEVIDILEQAKAHQALTIAAHPLSTGQFEFQTLHLWSQRHMLGHLIDAWEVNSGKKIYPEVLTSDLPKIASSDFHHKWHWESWRTTLFCEKDKDAIFTAIRNQNLDFCYVRNFSSIQEGSSSIKSCPAVG